jgi:glutathione S-transferase
VLYYTVPSPKTSPYIFYLSDSHPGGWVRSAFWAAVDIDEFPALKAWEERLLRRPGFEKGRQVPGPDSTQELKNDAEKMKRTAEEARAWIQAGMKDDARRK